MPLTDRYSVFAEDEQQLNANTALMNAGCSVYMNVDMVAS